MLYYFLGFADVMTIIVLVVLLAGLAGRWMVFKKMGVRPWLSLIPLVHEYVIFKKCWKAWPFVVMSVIAAVLLIAVEVGGYVDIEHVLPEMLRIPLVAALCVVLVIITVIMYKRLAFAFGHDIGYLAGLLFLNPIFLLILGFSGDTYHEELARMEGKELRAHVKHRRSKLAKFATVVAVIVFVLGTTAGIGYKVLMIYMPTPVVELCMDQFEELVGDKADGEGKVIYPAREVKVADNSNVRDLYYPDTAKAKDVSVHVYLIGSNLENRDGSASYNITEMIDATKEGSNLEFIIEAGGSGRWIEDSIKDWSVGRYMIKDGKVTLLEELDDKTCMSEPETLEDFLKWAGREYPADREILVLWDHGGGLAGYGYDYINRRDGKKILSVPEIAGALKGAGSRYEIIDFDACLMQTMEVARALEPYTDYLLASEESEPGLGQYYTSPFGALAKDPTISTVKFGAMICSSYDQYQKAQHEGEAQTECTMSLVDVRKVPAVYDAVTEYLNEEKSKFKDDRMSFIDLSKARARAYEFMAKDHIDLIDFLSECSMPKEEKNEIIDTVKSAILVRNAASAEHINGMSFYMPYNDFDGYSELYSDMGKLKLQAERNVYNDFASIVASQKVQKGDNTDELPTDYSDEKWYVKGYENYDASLLKQDIPLNRKGKTQTIKLSDEDWKLVTKVETGVRMKVGSRYADLGNDTAFTKSDNGRYSLEYDGTWATINGIPVALTPVNTQQTDEGNVYISKVPATLNMFKHIDIYIQRDERSGAEEGMKILGYVTREEEGDDATEEAVPKGYEQFETGNIVTFMYDWYDEEGNYEKTALGHLPVKVGKDGLKPEQSDITSEDFYYYGVIYDTVNHRMETKKISVVDGK